MRLSFIGEKKSVIIVEKATNLLNATDKPYNIRLY